MGRQLAETVTQGLVWAMARALYPGFSSVAANPAELARTYTMSSAVIFACGLPCAIGLALVSPSLVPLVFGERWVPMVLIVQGFCLVGAMRMLVIGIEPLLMAQGKTDVMFRRTLAIAVVRPVLAVLGILWFGLEGILLGAFGGVIVYLLQSFLILRTAVAGWGRVLAGSLARSGFAAFSMACLVLWVQGARSNSHSTGSLLAGLGTDVALGAAVYLGVHLLTWRALGKPEGAELRLLRLGHQRNSRLFRAP
jgi:O-antigen/teichoic acid export membrane protein